MLIGELEPGDVIRLPHGIDVEVLRVDVYPADPELAARGLRAYAEDAYVVVYRAPGPGIAAKGLSYPREECDLARHLASDEINAFRPTGYIRQARQAAGGQTGSPALADTPPAAGVSSFVAPEPRARPTDPATSHAAAKSLRAQELRRNLEAVLSLIEKHGPMDDVELVDRYVEAVAAETLHVQSPSGIRTRRHELVEAGRLRDSGRKTRLETGRYAIVWELPEGPVALTIEQEYDPEPDL